MPAPEQRPSGCAFHPRCPSALPECGRTVPELLQLRNRHGGRSESPHLVACPYAHTAEPPTTSTGSTSLRVKGNSSTGISGRTRSTTPADTGEILRVENLSKHFDKETFFSRAARALKLGTASRKKVFALNDASLTVRLGETVAVVGESGSGKSTLARIVAGLLRPDAGQVRFVGTNGRPRIAMIFQDPYVSLNPRMTAGETIEEALRIYAPALNTDARRRRALELLTHVGLPADAHRRRPHEFSGGQRQRISIARALACEPDLLLCDEPTSALDVSVQAQILNLLKTLQREHAMSMLFISHDLGVVRHMCDRVAVMRQGRIVECDTREAVFGTPKHPYTRMLLASGAAPTPSR